MTDDRQQKISQFFILSLIVGIAVILLTSFDGLRAGHPHVNLNHNLAVIAENADYQSIEKVLAPDAPWEQQERAFNPGITKSAYWMKVDLPMIDTLSFTNDDGWILEIGYPLLDDINIWLVNNTTIVQTYQSGDRQAFHARPIKNNKFAFPLNLDANYQQTLIIRVQTESSFRLPLTLWQAESYSQYSREFNLLIGILFGAFLAMVLNSLFFWCAAKQTSFLAYAIYVLSVASALFANYGYGFQFLWPERPDLQGSLVLLTGYSTTVFGLMFTYYFLALNKEHKSLAVMVKVAMGVVTIASICCFFVDYQPMLVLLMAAVIVCSLLSLGIGFVCLTMGNPFARIYILAWSSVLLSGVGYGIVQIGVIDYNGDPQAIFLAGAFTENLIFAYSLASSYHRQRERAHQRQVEREASLEIEVKDRSWELEIALRELAEKNQALEQLTTIDALTDCHNRRYFDKRHLAEVRRAKRHQEPVALAMIDIDHFKSVNDRFGHLAGDECLRQVALVLKSSLKRSADLLFRYGGEEFAIIMPSTDAGGAHQVLDNIRKRVEETVISFAEHKIQTTVSIGFCSGIIPLNLADDELLTVADQALFFAKRRGRNTVIEHPLTTDNRSQGS